MRIFAAMNSRILLLLPSLFPTAFTQTKSPYTPTWESLDSRPLPEWYDKAKVGIFIHTGVFSVPSFYSEWFWCYWKCPDRIQQVGIFITTGLFSVPSFYSEWFWAYWKRPGDMKQSVVDFMAKNYPPGFTYQDFGPQFTYEFFNATQWIEIFERAGAKYAVLTTKHHEGFTLWPSKYSFSWNSVDVGPKRDIVAEFTGAVRRSSSLHLGLYHSLYEWFNPLYVEDKAKNFTTRNYPVNKGTAELYELVERYSPDLLWSDGDAGPPEYWKSKEFLAWLYNQSNVKDKVVVNDRWGYGTSCKHGGYWNCADRYNPGTSQTHKWENAMTLDKKSWGYRRNSQLKDYLTIDELVKTLTETMSNGGNILINVGPTKEGTIPVIMEERLSQLGSWLSVNGESVYNSMPWLVHNDTVARDVFYVANRDGAVYATVLGKGRHQVDLAGIAGHMTGETEVLVVGTASKCVWELVQGVVRVHVGGDPATSVNAGLGYVLRFNKIAIKKLF